MADDLVAFLGARLDERERHALKAHPGPWKTDEGTDVYVTHRMTDKVVDYAGDSAEHVVANGPRTSSATSRPSGRSSPNTPPEPHTLARGSVVYYCGVCQWDDGRIIGDYPCRTISHLAAPHSDHPNYRAEWAPDA
ncbi:DUF6221 family protein [Embleya sp. AB8]|uniref:DUF6221 family protein n=1 Tax=Embleya sp. AB8 TaxID=3156304 RepID=UPI003C7392FE